MKSLNEAIESGSFFRVLDPYKGLDADLMEEVNQSVVIGIGSPTGGGASSRMPLNPESHTTDSGDSSISSGYHARAPTRRLRRRLTNRNDRIEAQSSMDDPLVETWLIHDRINRYLLDAVPDDAMGAALPKCRTVSDLILAYAQCPA